MDHTTLGRTGLRVSVIASILGPPLPEADRRRLADTFGRLTGVGLDLP